MSAVPDPTRRPKWMMVVGLGGPIGMLLLVWREMILGAHRPGMLVNDVLIVALTTFLLSLLVIAMWRQLGMRLGRDGIRQPFSGMIPWDAVSEVLVRPGVITVVSGERKIAIAVGYFSLKILHNFLASPDLA